MYVLLLMSIDIDISMCFCVFLLFCDYYWIILTTFAASTSLKYILDTSPLSMAHHFPIVRYLDTCNLLFSIYHVKKHNVYKFLSTACCIGNNDCCYYVVIPWLNITRLQILFFRRKGNIISHCEKQYCQVKSEWLFID